MAEDNFLSGIADGAGDFFSNMGQQASNAWDTIGGSAAYDQWIAPVTPWEESSGGNAVNWFTSGDANQWAQDNITPWHEEQGQDFGQYMSSGDAGKDFESQFSNFTDQFSGLSDSNAMYGDETINAIGLNPVTGAVALAAPVEFSGAVVGTGIGLGSIASREGGASSSEEAASAFSEDKVSGIPKDIPKDFPSPFGDKNGMGFVGGGTPFVDPVAPNYYTAPDGNITTSPSGIDPNTGLPVYEIYPDRPPLGQGEFMVPRPDGSVQIYGSDGLPATDGRWGNGTAQAGGATGGPYRGGEYYYNDVNPYNDMGRNYEYMENASRNVPSQTTSVMSLLGTMNRHARKRSLTMKSHRIRKNVI